MPKKPLTLSIVIPVFNEENYLGNCLDSIAAQTEMPDEVIVVDNNSTDKTVEAAKKYRFVKVIHEPRQGIVFARDTGFDEAVGDIIGRIDADTHLAVDWCAQTKTYFQSHPQVSAVTGRCYFYDFPLRKLVHLLHVFTYYELQKWIAGTNILWGSNMAITQSAWRRVSGSVDKNDRGHEDIDLALKLKKQGLKVGRDKKMLADVSMRRGDLGLGSLARYLNRWPQTYWLNGFYMRAFIIYLLALITWGSAILAIPLNFIFKLARRV